MATFVEILQALGSQIEDALAGQTDFDVHVEPMWFPIAEMPAIDMYPGNASGLESEYAGFTKHTTVAGIPITIRARVGLADGEAGQGLLYSLMDDEGTLSIVAAIDADRSLGGTVDSLTWGGGYPWTAVGPYLDVNGDGTLAGAEMTLVVVKTQS